MNLIKINILLFLFLVSCQGKSNRDDSWKDAWGLLSLEIPNFYFTFPGRDTPEASKLAAKRKLLTQINLAKSEITGYIYSLDDMDILISLRSAKNRGVNIFIQGDREEDYSEAEKFDINVIRWRGNGIHHTKIWIFDQKLVYWGTGNFTSQGMTQDNNVFWQTEIQESEYENLIKILREEEAFGIFYLKNLPILFSPQAGRVIQDTFLKSIRDAKNSIRFMIFTHFDPLISHELLKACLRGVRVEGIYNEPVNAEGTTLARLIPYPCRVFSDGNFDVLVKNGTYLGGLLHHKTMIIDEEKVLVGTYNYTVSARDENREVFFQFDTTSIIKEFLGEWKRVLSVAKLIDGSRENFDEGASPEYLVTDLNLSLISSLLIESKKNNIWVYDKNSSGLAKELYQSFDLQSKVTAPTSLIMQPNHFTNTAISLPGSIQWLNETLRPVSNWNLITFWNRVQVKLNPQVTLTGIYLWDGKKLPTYFGTVSPDSFDPSILPKLKLEMWVVFVTSDGFYHGCTKKNEDPSSRWIVYLQQKQLLASLTPSKCLNY